MTKFHQWLTDEARGGQGELREPVDALNNPYTSHHGMDGHPVWEIMVKHPERAQNFQNGLIAMGDPAPIIGSFDWSKLYHPETDGERPTVVDVGGGQGQSLQQILQAHPSLKPDRMVLQELESPIAQAREMGYLPKEVVLQQHDFWTPQPVKGAKAYLLRRVLHDYADDNCSKILSQIKEAMQPDSRVIIADVVLPNKISGMAVVGAASDNMVMAMGGKERSVNGFKKILDHAGLELVRVWGQMGGDEGIASLVEAKLKE